MANKTGPSSKPQFLAHWVMIIQNVFSCWGVTRFHMMLLERVHNPNVKFTVPYSYVLTQNIAALALSDESTTASKIYAFMTRTAVAIALLTMKTFRAHR